MRQGHPLAQTFTLQSDDEDNEGFDFKSLDRDYA